MCIERNSGGEACLAGDGKSPCDEALHILRPRQGMVSSVFQLDCYVAVVIKRRNFILILLNVGLRMWRSCDPANYHENKLL